MLRPNWLELAFAIWRQKSASKPIPLALYFPSLVAGRATSAAQCLASSFCLVKHLAAAHDQYFVGHLAILNQRRFRNGDTSLPAISQFSIANPDPAFHQQLGFRF